MFEPFFRLKFYISPPEKKRCFPDYPHASQETNFAETTNKGPQCSAVLSEEVCEQTHSRRSKSAPNFCTCYFLSRRAHFLPGRKRKVRELKIRVALFPSAVSEAIKLNNIRSIMPSKMSLIHVLNSRVRRVAQSCSPWSNSHESTLF
ncbi:hypothetical protein PoB_003392000 [Plakobranchus ocellatus]|uniref:Uncharacterized protein n=1 Tax=Plakobranchus ocellatus TaxID=259542 RepID=A0AAV4AJA2_9GAST|nr:hypothetical protein PoB_003392000 [Plakobranchus ocellatus]